MIANGTKVKIDVMAADSTFEIDETLRVVRNTRDKGVGIVLAYLQDEEGHPCYQIAIIEGRFDPHRNDDGEFWASENELTPI